MVEPILHFIIPVSLMLIFFPRFYKTILSLSWLSILPDLDSFLGLHRAVFHNIFFAVLFSMFILILFLLFNYKNFESRKKAAIIFSISLFFLFSHIVLDLGGPGVAMFYPFSDKLISLNLFLYANPQTFEIGRSSEIKLNPGEVVFNADKANFLSTTGLVIVFLGFILLIGFLLSLFMKRYKKY